MESVLMIGMVSVFALLICVIGIYYMNGGNESTSRIRLLRMVLFSTKRRELITWELLGALSLMVYVVPGIFLSDALLPLVVITCVFLPVVIYFRTHQINASKEQTTR